MKGNRLLRVRKQDTIYSLGRVKFSIQCVNRFSFRSLQNIYIKKYMKGNRLILEPIRILRAVFFFFFLRIQ